MCDSSATRADFIDRVLTSSFPGEATKRFAFADGEVAALYTTGYDSQTGQTGPVVLYLATFPPAQRPGLHDFGLDYWQQPVATAEEAAHLLAQFGPEQAAQFRATCRAHLTS